MSGNFNHEQDLISIVTPTYNAEAFILDTVKSVQAQTFNNWEMIIVDDCSKDNTVDIIKDLLKSDSRIKLIELKVNSGAAVARNTALLKARGRYVAFLDSDDKWFPEKLEKQINFMKHRNIAFSFTSYEFMDQYGNNTGKIVRVPSQIDYAGLLKNTIIGCLTVMLDTNKLGKVEMPNIRTRQDTALWLSILKKGNVAYGIQEPLAMYRKVTGSISSNKFKMAKNNWNMYRRVEKLSVLHSIWCFVNYAYNALKKNI
ncbi:glycosyltransferase [Rossellomorea vietnamensis]|uniref:Glycosyltransferase n=1 Tax=Rossellomorea vietnamensis TaxID=218284 RepID=A0A6I6UK23_9BACI|nr:glycosyltransferase family 2 protein [Rossellomorea vietnamensis]QHE63334.1 glycosyltransferase [Rossellomorea vietnamensis]